MEEIYIYFITISSLTHNKKLNVRNKSRLGDWDMCK